MNEIINRKTNRSKLPSTFVCDPLCIANKVCDYFTNIGPRLANQLPQTEASPMSFLKNKVPESIFIAPVTENEVKQISMSFKAGKAVGFDGIDMSDIKPNIEFLAGPLSYLINLSISSGTVPDCIKLAKVIPIFKSDCHLEFNNYRPISILPSFSKFFEKIMFNRLVAFLNKQNVFYEHQYGFTPSYSTTLAMIHLVEQISSSIDNKEICAGIFLDLSKAFDTVNHKILLNKLEHYGIRGIALDWVKSYLNDRKQYVEVNNVASAQKTVKCGIPQGSILGPLLFILYVNDISNSSEILKFILFADDTNIFYSCKDIENLENTLNTELEKVSVWLIVNKLSINIKKTKYIIFKTRQKRITPHNMLIKVNNETIEQKESIKFLGVIIDESLSWKEHINVIASKISRTIGVISRAKFFHFTSITN